MRTGRVAAGADPPDDLAGRDLLPLLDEGPLHHVAVPGHDVAGALNLHHPAAAALAGIAVDIAGAAAAVVLVTLDLRDDAAGRRQDRGVPRRAEVDALMVGSLRRPEAGDHALLDRKRPARGGDLPGRRADHGDRIPD